MLADPELLSLLDLHFCEVSLQADGIERREREERSMTRASVEARAAGVRFREHQRVPIYPCCVPMDVVARSASLLEHHVLTWPLQKMNIGRLNRRD